SAPTRLSADLAVGLQVDADHEQLRARPADDLRVRASPRIPRHDSLKPFPWILVDDGRDAGAPPPADVDPDTWLRLDVPDVVRVPPVLGDDPEHVAVKAIGHRRHARDAALAANRLDQRRAPTTKAQANRGPRDPVYQPHSPDGVAVSCSSSSTT